MNEKKHSDETEKNENASRPAEASPEHSANGSNDESNGGSSGGSSDASKNAALPSEESGPPPQDPPEKSDDAEASEAAGDVEAGESGPPAAFPVVGIGASAGGVQALESFFEQVKEGIGAAFVVIQHLAPDKESVMPSLLGKRTPLPVSHAQEGMRLKPEHVYLLPPGKELRIRQGAFDLRNRPSDGAPKPIDTFFRSLAEFGQERAIAVVLSGSGTDGTLGAKAVKGEGGLVLAQQEDQASHRSMPRSVIDAGLADRILPVERMAEAIADYVSHPVLVEPKTPETDEEKLEGNLRAILMIVRSQTGVDFIQYKRNTMRRRIARRMALQQVSDYFDYRRMLRQEPAEVERLFKDLTINVTRFFRDEFALERLVERAIRPLMEDKKPDTPLRLWVPGCSTGEEAYSLAILLLEALETLEKFFEIKIFATDINEDAISAARSGVYPEAISADVSPERLKRFFSKKGQQYQVDSKIRDMIVFAVHDVTRDPPFSNLDIISCRNLLIYMNSDLQRKVLPVFHFSLNPESFLFLGMSETIGEAGDLFVCESKKGKVYRKKSVPLGKLAEYQMPIFQANGRKPTESRNHGEAARPRGKDSDENRESDLRQTVQEALLRKYTDSAVLLDESGEVLFFHGHTGPYLSPPEGAPNFNIFNMTDGELRLRLSQGMEAVHRKGKPVTASDVHYRIDDHFATLELGLTPVGANRGWILAEFREPPKPPKAEEKEAEGKEAEGKEAEGGKAAAEEGKVAELENKLRSTQQELQATIEELETSNEELKSANEELQANNEELQSTNEELESSKEELQSTNEELETLNSELYSKNQELLKAEDDLKNLFASNEVATLFLDEDLRIQRFTPNTENIFNLRESDAGRRISDITCKLTGVDVVRVAEEVLDKLARHESKVTTRDEDDTYLMRAAPYRTRENVIEGVVLSFLNVSQYEKQAAEVRDARTLFKKITEVIREPILVLDEALFVQSANPGFYRMFQTAPTETEGREVFRLDDGQWDAPELRRFLEEIIPENRFFTDYVFEHDFPRLGRRKMMVSGRKIEGGEVRRPIVLVTFRDASEETD